MLQRMMNAEEFAEERFNLPDGGQWAELVRGVPVTLSAPDIDHGTIVLNLSKVFGEYVQSQPAGYPCFDLGIQVESKPDTVFFPAVCYFTEGERFSEADFVYTTSTPPLVVELVTTADRRSNINERSQCHISNGTRIIWAIDSQNRVVHVIEKGNPHAKRITEFETLKGDPILKGFSVSVGKLFEEPEWAK